MSGAGPVAPAAGIELGGTKVVVGRGTGPEDLTDVVRIPTTTPGETLAAVVSHLRRGPAPRAIGVASFGPIDCRADSPTYGHVLATPKPGWAGTDVVGTLAAAYPGVPVALETDVNGAALGEHRWGAGADGLGASLLYLTVGTGIGGGAVVDGRLLVGLAHPEMGHIAVPHDRARDPFDGVCPFHGDCLEGLASGPAVAARWGRPGEELPPDHAAWPLEAEYLAAALQTLVLTLVPGRIVLGGGVAGAPGLLPRVREGLAHRLGGYLTLPEVGPDGLAQYVLAPVLGRHAGVLGALALATDAIGAPPPAAEAPGTRDAGAPYLPDVGGAG